MPQKVLAAILAVICFNSIFFTTGIPRFGTFGFLLLINFIQAFLFLGYQKKIMHMNQLWAGIVSMLAILGAIIGVFRADPLVLQILGVTSLILSVISLYLFSLRQGNVTGILEVALIPISLVNGYLTGLYQSLFTLMPRWQRLLAWLLVILAISIVLTHRFSFGFSRLQDSILIFVFSYSLTQLKTEYAITYRLKKSLLARAYNEVTIVSVITLVLLLAYVASSFNKPLDPNVRFSGPKDLEFNLVSVFLISLIGYVVSAISFPVLKAVKNSVFILKSVNAVITTIVLGSIAATSYWLITSSKVETSTTVFFTSLFGLIFIFILSLVLLFRLIRSKYSGWLGFEFLLMISVIYVFGLVNIHAHWIRYRFLDNGEPVSLHALDSLSADTAFAWVANYEHTKTNLAKIELDRPNEWSENDIEIIETATKNLSSIRSEYLTLAQRYGSTNAVETLSPIHYSQDKVFKRSLIIEIADVNIAEWNSYRVLNEYIYAEELVRMDELSADLEAYARLYSKPNLKK